MLTNSRALRKEAAFTLMRMIVQNLRAASRIVEKSFPLVSPGDSTLRGHYPAEIDAIQGELGGILIFNQCSSVGEVADAAAEIVRMPVIKVDSRMAGVACAAGIDVGVVATLETTLGPICRLIEATVARLGRDAVVTRKLVLGVGELIADRRIKHNDMVLGAVRDLTKCVDVVVCAQGGMVGILPELGTTRVPVSSSHRLGVESAANLLNAL